MNVVITFQLLCNPACLFTCLFICFLFCHKLAVLKKSINKSPVGTIVMYVVGLRPDSETIPF